MYRSIVRTFGSEVRRNIVFSLFLYPRFRKCFVRGFMLVRFCILGSTVEPRRAKPETGYTYRKKYHNGLKRSRFIKKRVRSLNTKTNEKGRRRHTRMREGKQWQKPKQRLRERGALVCACAYPALFHEVRKQMGEVWRRDVRGTMPLIGAYTASCHDTRGRSPCSAGN